MHMWEEYAFEKFITNMSTEIVQTSQLWLSCALFSCLYREKNSTVEEVCNAPHHTHC